MPKLVRIAQQTLVVGNYPVGTTREESKFWNFEFGSLGFV
jgi:hypothetical protein